MSTLIICERITGNSGSVAKKPGIPSELLVVGNKRIINNSLPRLEMYIRLVNVVVTLTKRTMAT